MNRLRPVIIWGGRGHAKVLNELLSLLQSRVIAVFDNDTSLSSPIAGVPIYFGMAGFESWIRNQNGRELIGAMVAIGGHRGGARLEISDRMVRCGLELITAFHPSAFIARDAVIAEGCQVLGNAAVCSEAKLGRGCIINTSATVDHESSLEEGVHVAPGATITGCVKVGARTMIGAGATVMPRIKIGRDVIVGAGAVVTRDIPDGKVAYGNPARVMRDNNS